MRAHAEVQWMPIGPFGGTVYELTFSKTQQNVVYAAAAGGVYVSRNGGGSWAPLGRLSPVWVDPTKAAPFVRSYWSVAEDSSKPGNVYALTTDAVLYYNASQDKWTALYQKPPGSMILISMVVDPSNPHHLFVNSGGQGLLESRDGGKSFAAIGRIGKYSVLQISSANPKDLLFEDTFLGIIKLSVDGGAHWRQLLISKWTAPKKVVFAGSDPNRLYAITGQPIGTPTIDVYRSDDLGNTWVHMAALDSPQGFPNSYTLAGSLFVDPYDSDVAYVSFVDTYITPLQTLFKTTDGGVTWTTMANKVMLTGVHNMEMDPFDTDHILALYGGAALGGLQLSSSWNGGDDFVATAEGLTASDITGLAVDAAMPDTIYTVADDGSFRTQDGGAQWLPFGAPTLDGYVPPDHLALDPLGGGYVYSISYEDGSVFVYDVAGATWYPFIYGDFMNVVPSETVPGVIYLSSCSLLDGVTTDLVSFDYGADWNFIGTDGCEANPASFVALKGGKVYKSLENTLTKSIDFGATWTQRAPMPWDMGPSVDDGLAFAVSPQSDEFLFQGMTKGIITSRNGGAGWRESYRCAAPPCGINAIYPDPNDAGKVYAATDYGLLESDNNGHDWGAASIPGLATHMSSVVTHPTWAPSVFAVATRDAGVFLKTDPTDIQISIAGGGSTVSLGDTVSYTVTVTNAGAVNARQVTLLLHSPSNAPFTLTDPGGATCSTEDDIGTLMSCNVPQLTAGAQWALTADVQMNSGSQAAFYAVANTAQGDTDFTNNAVFSKLESQAGTDLSVAVKAPSATMHTGAHSKLFSVTLTNTGADAPVDLVIHYGLLAQRVRMTSSDFQCTAIDHGFTCHLDSLANGATATLPFSGSLPTAGRLSIAAFVKPVGLKDAVQTNNSDAFQLTVIP